MTKLEQAIQKLEELQRDLVQRIAPASCQNTANETLDILRSIENSEVPLAAIMEAVAEGMNNAEDAGEDPMSWIQSCVSRIKGVSNLNESERLPTIKLKR